MSDQYLWLIWNYERSAWWRPDRRGYTSQLKEAGRYRYGEAVQICTDANWPPGRIEDEMVHTCNAESFMAKKKMPEKMREKAQKMKEKAADKKAEKK